MVSLTRKQSHLIFLLILRCLLPAIALMESSSALAGPEAEKLQRELDELQARRTDVPGFAIALVLPDGEQISAATGVANSHGDPMTSDTPVRIASITKTFVAVAVLRLVEANALSLDDPLSKHINEKHSRLLADDGYDVRGMSIRQVLMHSSGLNDHFSGSVFKQLVIENPGKIWSRTEQLALMVETTEPVGDPGKVFSYSDTGYLLLAEAVENLTEEPLASAVRRLTKLSSIGLEHTWWDTQSQPSGMTHLRAHQWLDGIDTYHFHGTVDSFGGGGLIASTSELALFFSALFSGQIFEDPETLELMLKAPGHPQDSPYRFGLFYGQVDGYDTYGHSGFWGTNVIVIPELALTIAGTSLKTDGMDEILKLRNRILREQLKQTVSSETSSKTEDSS